MATPTTTTATTDVIHSWMPANVFYKASAPAGQKLRFRGIISTEHRDLQGEIVVQSGMDLTAINSGHGWLNDNHNRRTGSELGIPTRTWQTTVTDGRKKIPATGVDGYLLDTPEGRQIFAKAKALRGTGRGYGFSVEGSVLERCPVDPKRVLRSRVRQIALTRCPVNPHTKMDVIAKSLTAVMEKAVEVGTDFPSRGGQPGQMGPTIPQDLVGAARRHPDAVQFFGGTAFDWDTFSHSGSSRAAAKAAARVNQTQAAAMVRRRMPGVTDAVIGAVLQRARQRRGTTNAP